VTTGFQCVDIRRFYKKEGEIKPTREGLALRLAEWSNLRPLELTLLKDIPALTAARQCFYGNDHQNLQGYLDCEECTPFDRDDTSLSIAE